MSETDGASALVRYPMRPGAHPHALGLGRNELSGRRPRPGRGLGRDEVFDRDGKRCFSSSAGIRVDVMSKSHELSVDGLQSRRAGEPVTTPSADLIGTGGDRADEPE